jgi:hypothetical protein
VKQKKRRKNKMIYTYDFVKESIRKNGIEKTRKLIYGEACRYEYIGMVKFINSRQRWCKRNILKILKES